MKVEVKGGSLERAIRQLRRKTDRDGLKERIRELEFYEKPTAKKKRMKAAAQKRQQKLTAEHKRYLVRQPRHKR
jgi:small subunit ribosomal protein S21